MNCGEGKIYKLITEKVMGIKGKQGKRAEPVLKGSQRSWEGNQVWIRNIGEGNKI